MVYKAGEQIPQLKNENTEDQPEELCPDFSKESGFRQVLSIDLRGKVGQQTINQR